MEAAILVYQRKESLCAGHLRTGNVSQNAVLAITIATHRLYCIVLHGKQHVAIGAIHAIERHSASPRRRQDEARDAFGVEATRILLVAVGRVEMNAALAIAGAIQRYTVAVI